MRRFRLAVTLEPPEDPDVTAIGSGGIDVTLGRLGRGSPAADPVGDTDPDLDCDVACSPISSERVGN